MRYMFSLPFLLTISPLIAHANVQLNTPPQSIFIYSGLGKSYSRKADIKVNLDIWDPAIQGYDHNLGNTTLYTFGVGYQLTCALSGNLEISYRPTYSYSKFQEPLPSSNTPGFLGTKTRKFRLKSTNFMFNMDMNFGAYGYYLDYQSLSISPFAGLGAGVAFNTVWYFHSVQATSTIPGFNDVGSVEPFYTHSTFAWQGKVGVELQYCKNWALDIGYRYFNGGRFKSNDFITNVAVGPNSATTSPAWRGKLKADEFFIYLKYSFV